MKTLYGIFDRLAKELISTGMYMVFAFRTDQQAIRYFMDAILDEKSILAKHPSDYELIRLGIIDEAGNILPDANASCIVITGDAVIAATTEHETHTVIRPTTN